MFTNVCNPRSAVNRKDEYRDTLAQCGATIGANSTIICGTTMGPHAFVAAGAVVNRDVKPYALPEELMVDWELARQQAALSKIDPLE